MIQRIFEISLSVVLCAMIHEGGHYMAAFCSGHKLRFRLQGLRGVWDMPDAAPMKQKVIALAGFGAEFLAVPIFYGLRPETAFWYAAAAVTHFAAYPFYAGGDNDFRWLV